MQATSAFLIGYLVTVPLIVLQCFLARAAAKRWPAWRYAAWTVVLLIFVHSVAGFPLFHGRLHMPAWLSMPLGWWTYASAPIFLCFAIVKWTGGFIVPRAQTDPSRRQLIHTAACAAAAIPAGALLYGSFIERDRFRVEESVIPVPNLHPDLEGFRVLLLSDVHRSDFLSQQQLTRVVDACREVQPHLIAHLGDFISGRGDPLEACLNELSRLNGNIPAFACLGNHEIYADAEVAATEIAERRGIRMLRYQNAQLKHGAASVNIAGVDYQKMSQRQNYLVARENLVVPGALNLLLSHNPDVFRKSSRMGFDVTLSGHTHGGQVRMEILHSDVDLARFYTPYVAGLYRSGAAACYVSRGIGCIGLPSRVGAPPEISSLRLTRA